MSARNAENEIIAWQTANQKSLSMALAVVRGHLARWITRSQETGQSIDQAVKRIVSVSLESAREAEDQKRTQADAVMVPPALELLCERFHLSPFERDLLLLCAGMELDSAFAPLCAAAQGDLNRHYPTFSLALAALPQAHWNALSLDSPLRRWRLIEFANSSGLAGAPLTTRPLRIDERVLQYLAGVPQVDERLAALIEPIEKAHRLMTSHHETARRIALSWQTSVENSGPLPVICLCGHDVSEALAIAVVAGASVELRLHCLAAHNIPTNAAERQTLIRLWERESVLSSSALFLDCSREDLEDSAREHAINDFAERLRGALIVFSRSPRQFRQRPAIRFDIPRPAAREQRAVWNAALGDVPESLEICLDAIVSRFNLSVPAINAAAAEFRTNDDPAPDRLWDACRHQSRPALEQLAERIESTATWDDLVLPEAQKQMLRDLLVQVRQRQKVYDEWGFGEKSARGYGVTALFAGASGTGKTLAAEVLANELRLDLYRIDLSSVVSKYVGETEKNLRRVFDAAESGGAILLFDEADALFGKRSEVKDSHDRYANLEVSYLLQRMESYRGLAILTTNLKHALDTAFQRRLNFIVEFPFPDAAQRAEIWRRVFPAATPTEGLDFEKLAQLNVAGGNIRNIAIHAASLAAEAEDVMRMKHLLEGARGEYAKLEKTLTGAEILEWK